MGIQGSGKSEFYNRYLSDSYVLINLDTLKTRNRERQLLKDCIDVGKDFAVDNTNPTKEDRQRYIVPAKASGYRVIGYFMESKLQACSERNNLREGKENFRRRQLLQPLTNYRCQAMRKDLMSCTLSQTMAIK